MKQKIYSFIEFYRFSKTDVNRITLVIDDLGGNGSDHGVWASPLLTYKGSKTVYLKL